LHGKTEASLHLASFAKAPGKAIAAVVSSGKKAIRAILPALPCETRMNASLKGISSNPFTRVTKLSRVFQFQARS